jgi:hypothetical protein
MQHFDGANPKAFLDQAIHHQTGIARTYRIGL